MSANTQGGFINRSTIVLVKAETTPGTDAVPTVGSNALVVNEGEHSPAGNHETYTRKVLVGDAQLGVQTPVPGIRSGTITLKLPCAGASAAGTAPDYGVLLKACGWSETIVGGTSVTYKLVATYAPVTIYVLTGPSGDLASGANWLRYKYFGCVGNSKFTAGSNGNPGMWEFAMQGTYNEPADISDPGDPTLIEIVPPPFLGVSSFLWTPNGGSAHAPIGRSFEVDPGNAVSRRLDFLKTSGIRSFLIGDRTPVVTMQLEMERAAAQNWFNDYTASKFGVMTTGVVGDTAGNRYNWTFNRIAQSQPPQLGVADEISIIDTQWHAAINVASLSTAAAQIAFT